MTGPIVVVGDVMADIVVRPLGPIRRGTDQTADIAMMAGGSGANQAAWLASLGVPVRLAARVGTLDRDRYAGAFAAQGVEPWLAGDDVRPTGSLICLIEQDGERSFLTSRGANTALGKADLPAALLEGASQLHISGYALFSHQSRGAVAHLIAVAREAGVAISVDPGSAGYLGDLGVDIFLAAIAGADTIVPNADEAALLTRERLPSAQCQALLERFSTVVLKQGALGAVAATRDGTVVKAAAAPAAVLDTTGAGDAFFAGFVAARRGGDSLETALASGNATAAKAISKLGGRPT